MHGSTAKAGWDENGMKMRQKWDKNGNDNGTFICYTIYYPAETAGDAQAS